MFAVFGFVVQVLEVSRVGLYVRAVRAVIEGLDEAVRFITRSFESIAFTMIYEDLVVCTTDGEALPIRTELNVLQTMPRISVICQSEQHKILNVKIPDGGGKRQKRDHGIPALKDRLQRLRVEQ